MLNNKTRRKKKKRGQSDSNLVNVLIGRVCVPIDPANVENFDPENVPTASDLINDIGAYDEEHKDAAKGTFPPILTFLNSLILCRN
jgi:hypothetical protein